MGKILKVKEVGEKDVYNPTAPFEKEGEECIAARVEERGVLWQDPGYSPASMFFVKRGECWVPDKNAPVFALEDPFKTFISGELIFGGVKVFGEAGKRRFRTVFYRGKSLEDLSWFAEGPEMMKDIRIVELIDKRIGVFTRPQGKQYGRGRIGFIVINSLEELNERNIERAEIIGSKLRNNEWVGVNDAKLLESGKIAVLAHRAKIRINKRKSYWAISFVLDPLTGEISNYRVIVTRDDFPPTPAKKPFLQDVVFPGELDYDHRLYAGLSDTSIGVKKVNNPYNEQFYLKKAS